MHKKPRPKQREKATNQLSSRHLRQNSFLKMKYPFLQEPKKYLSLHKKDQANTLVVEKATEQLVENVIDGKLFWTKQFS